MSTHYMQGQVKSAPPAAAPQYWSIAYTVQNQAVILPSYKLLSIFL